MSRPLFVAVSASALLLLALPAVWAGSGVQVTVDGSANLISKDVGNERWAITYDLGKKTASGNVFRSDGGDPAFVWCQNTSESSDTATLNCFGADRCESEPCSDSDWTSLGQVQLPLGFFYPPTGAATPLPNPTSTPRPTATPVPTDALSDLLGTWNFTFKINSTFTDTYRLRRIETVSGVRTAVGLDQFGETVIANRVQELTPGSSIPEEFGLFDNSLFLCELHLFDHALGSDSVTGRTVVTLGDGTGGCDTSFGDIYAMTGVRTSRSAGTAAFDDTRKAAAQASRARGEYVVAEHASVASGVPLDPDLRAVFESMGKKH